MLSVVMLNVAFNYHYAECRFVNVVMLNVVMLNVVVLNVVMLSVVTQADTELRSTMLFGSTLKNKTILA
jgi:hypothetical protein